MKFRFRFTQLAILLFLLGLLTFSLAGLAYFATSYTIDDLSTQLLDQTMLRVEQKVNVLLSAAQSQAGLQLKPGNQPSLTVEDFPHLVDILSTSLETNQELTSLFITLEATGECIGVSRLASDKMSLWQLTRDSESSSMWLREFHLGGKSQKQQFNSVPNWKEYEIRERPWYVAAKSAGGPIWTESYPWIGVEGETAVQGISYAVPIYEADKLTAVLSIDIGLKQMSEYLQTVKIGQRGYAFILEQRQNDKHYVIAHPKSDLLLSRGDSDSLDLTPIGEFGDPQVQLIVEHLPVNFPSKNRSSDSLVPLRISHSGDSYIAQYKRLANGENAPKWILCTVLSEDEIMNRIHGHTIFAVILFLLILAIVIGLSFYISSQISHPLELMAAEARAIGTLQLESKEPQHSLILEVDLLGKAIESMKTGLRSFQKYVPSDLVEALVDSGKEAALGGELREITVFFSDIVGFTTIAEQLQPEEVVELMREYLSAMTEEVTNGEGTVDKYIGDAVMAFWGAPRIHPNHALAACKVALASRSRLAELNKKWQSEGKPTIEIRIGLHTGEAVVGNIGSHSRLNYTVMGDAVNLASRLEGLNKYYSTSILISQDTYRAAPGIVARPLDVVSVMGKSQAVLVYELLNMDDSNPELVQLANVHSQAWEHYQAQDWEAAIAGFEQVIERKPEDLPAKQFIQRCREYQANPPGSDWDGVFRMHLK